MSQPMSTKRFFYEKFKEIANQITGPLTQSEFQRTGKLTPQEFMEAGDALTQKFPGWRWETGLAADGTDPQPYLARNKKYLILRECPCRERAAEISTDVVTDAADEDGWVETPEGAAAAAAAGGGAAAGANAPATNAAAAAQQVQQQQAQQPMQAFNYGADDDEDEDENAAPAASAVASTGANSLLRFYNVVISYDQYYGSPRMYLFGYKCGQQNTPLTADEMYEDVYSANRGQTATIDPHPYVHAPCISIHPCRHAEMMKRTLDRLDERFQEEQEDLPEQDRIPFVFPTYMALFVFLKFITAVVPTIAYDVTIDVEM